MKSEKAILTSTFTSIMIILTLICVTSSIVLAGPYAPAAGQPGSTAIYKDDSSFVEWASSCDVVRGLQNISDSDVNDDGTDDYASFGTADNALGKAVGDSYDVVSLGDGGYATLTFDVPISDGPGWDFAVFENGFSDTYLELAFVEVSSDGVNFFRFDSVSLTQTDTQIGGFGTLDPTDIYNLAGKYRQGYGTPFDLSELSGRAGLDIYNVTYVRIVDVVGCIQDAYCRYDSTGNKINDPWPTPFSSSGFDLDAVGVINAKSVPEPATFMILITIGIWGITKTRKYRV